MIDLLPGDSPFANKAASALAALSGVGKQIPEPLRKLLEEQRAAQEIWAKQSEQVAEGVKPFTEALDKAESIGKYGWFIPEHATPGQITSMFESITDEASADAAYLSYFTSFDNYHLNVLIKEILANKKILPWKPLLKEAVFCLRKKKYRVCIASLLPIVDGLCASQFSTSIYKKGTRNAFVEDRRQWIADNGFIMRYQWMAFIGFIDILFCSYEFDNLPTTMPVLSRHILLHGRNIPQAKLEDCIRLLLALDAISNLAEWL